MMEVLDTIETANSGTRRQSVLTTKVSGMISRKPFGVTKNIVTQMSVESLLNSLSMRAMPEELAALYKDVQRVTTVSRCDAFEDYYSNHLLGRVDVAGCIPTITIALSKRPLIRQFDDRLDVIEFDPQTAFASDGLGRLNTFMRTIGGYAPTIRGVSKPNQARIQRRQMLRSLVSHLEVSVKIVFGNERDLTKEDIGQLFSDINFTQTKVQPRHAMRLNSTDPVINWAREMAKMPIIKDNGGMSEVNTSVTSQAQYVTTLSVLTRYCRGVIGGDYLQTRNGVSLLLKDGSEVSRESLDQLSSLGSLFFEQWEKYQGERFIKDRTGHQLSSSVIQALGLVVYTIIYKNTPVNGDGVILDQLDQAAKKLAALDYSRFAEHWSRCAVMTKKEKGYANGTSGGRTFRLGLADYFCKLVGYNLVY
ncbi:DNA sulfur modification protein DndB [Cysteiniphilum marinum]|uniref:DNA sulfur modification protein DndB n=1 Tax=Cysteiniphilum marinum TaxID=2774191 RepID=UPI00193A23AC|nr:DNA sulfur modification protein DndB [Cysteiniphilum marinum]